MTHSYQSPLSVYEQLGSIRLSAAERREAIAHMRQTESIADLIVSAARLLRQASAEFKHRPRPSQKEFVDAKR
jgi:hypothetical protein